MTRIIVHAGFHKTGTTSLQAFLQNNAAQLAPFAAIYQKKSLGHARYLGRWYGQRPVFWRRWMFRLGLRAFLRDIPDPGDRVVVISRESFSGMMLGFRGSRLRPPRRYAPMAVPLAREILRELTRRFGTGARVEFLYTLRDGEAFLKSAWGHVLRTTRLKQDYPAFRNSFGPLPDLEADAAEIARALAPVPVHVARLEDYGTDRFGPARALIDLLDIPDDVRAQFSPVARHNPGQSPALSAQFLEMNRASPRGRALYRAKEELAMAERAAETRRQPRYARTAE